jgi:XTP/dITP diphosphohydrolase
VSRPSGERLIVLATANRGKVVELAELCRNLPVKLALLGDMLQDASIPEPFATFHENAAHKALTAAILSNAWALGEDSGLEVDALGGRPGVYSARFAGKASPDRDRVKLLLASMADIPPDRRTAHFRCAMALASPGGLLGEWHGECEGRVAEAPRGAGGFGFDPVFIAAGESRTMAEMSTEEKNAISHRGNALRQLLADLPRLLSTSAVP